MSVADLAELQATVQRMERALVAKDDAAVRALMQRYQVLKRRFEVDLADPRDVALACSAALMLVQSVSQQQP